MEIQDLVQFSQIAKQLQPQVSDTVDELTESYGPLLKETLKTIFGGMAEVQGHYFQELKNNGFSPSEALQVLTKTNSEILSKVNNMEKKK